MEEQVISKFLDLGVIGIAFLGLAYMGVKMYIQDKAQAREDREKDREQMVSQIAYYQNESKEQRDLFTETLNKFHGQMDKFGDALNTNNNQIQILNENFVDMENKVDAIQQEISSMKSAK